MAQAHNSKFVWVPTRISPQQLLRHTDRGVAGGYFVECSVAVVVFYIGKLMVAVRRQHLQQFEYQIFFVRSERPGGGLILCNGPSQSLRQSRLTFQYCHKFPIDKVIIIY